MKRLMLRCPVVLFVAALAALLVGGCAPKTRFNFERVERSFRAVPDEVQTSIYWFWLSDNISKAGVVKDLQAMKSQGINRVFIANIGLQDVPYGRVKMFTDEWWEITHAALKTASDLDIEIGIFNSAGWSQSGGPWVKPSQSMRYLASSDTLLSGPLLFNAPLAVPAENFQDVRVLAFRSPGSPRHTLPDLRPSLHSTPRVQDIGSLMDNDLDTSAEIPVGLETVIDVAYDESFEVRSLTIYPAKRGMKFDVCLEVANDGVFEPIKKFQFDRSNTKLHVGFVPFAPVVESFESVKAKAFRIRIKNASPGSAIAEINLSGEAKVARHYEKTLAKMHPTPLPFWEQYQWPMQAEIERAELALSVSEVLDITDKLNEDGVLNWVVPEGEWVVLRTGMLPTGVMNDPASPESIGLEIDKMSELHAAQHFDEFLGEIQRRIPAKDRRTWKVAVMDSYEVGGQNWTDDFIDKFRRRFEYDPTPYIPAMFGYVVDSQDRSDRFLWDLRRFVADQLAYEYVGGFRRKSNQHGLSLWLENYGHWGFPGEFLQYGGQADEVAGEFWSEGELGDIENRAAASAAHIYGKNIVTSESFTAAGNPFGRYPAMFKQRGDRFFTEGINSTLLNTSIQQPDDRVPGVNATFGNEFNRHNTWFGEMDIFVDYLKRCNLMLQQGTYVADVAYFIGEDAPKMTGIQEPALPTGYSFDYINAEVILTRLSFKDGFFTLPDGMRYKLLVLPQLETITPELLSKIGELVKAGGTILGPRPSRSPSLRNFGSADGQVKKLAAEMWGGINGKEIYSNRHGLGLVMDGVTMQTALDKLGLLPDVALPAGDSTLYIHRQLADGDIYFLSNQRNLKIKAEPIFRTVGRIPELWNPIDGTVRKLPVYTVIGETTQIPIELDSLESAFIVFRELDSGRKPLDVSLSNFPSPLAIIPHSEPWSVSFDSLSRGAVGPVVFNELTDWSVHPDTSIAFYAGTAMYKSTLDLPAHGRGHRLVLDLGSVVALAKVYVNGKYAGGVWTAPYSLDVTDLLHVGKNDLEIKVVNTWPNRLIGDQHLPEINRQTFTYINPYTVHSPLHRAGLLGPVHLQVFRVD